MSNTPINNLPSAPLITGNEEIPAVQSNQTVRITAQQIADLVTTTGTVTSINTTSPITGGPITTSGTIALASNGVTNSYLATMPANTIKGNASGSVVQPSDITATQVLDMIGSTQGSLLTRGSVSWQALTAGSQYSILASNGTSVAPSYTSISSLLDSVAGSAQGSLLYRNGSSWTALPPGTSGSVLTTNGGSANPTWNVAGGTGTVTSIAQGTGMNFSANPITVSGTINLADTAVTPGSYGSQSSVPVITVDQQGRLTAASDTPINAVSLTTGTISTAPTNPTDIANKDYVDSVAQGLNFHAACNYATTAALNATYNNGSSGVGATLTNAGTLVALVVDGSSPIVGDRILVKNQVNAAQNGAYTVTNVGSGAVAWVLTRATDYDTSGTGTNEIDAGDFMYVLSGSVNTNTSWVQQTPLPITVGTTGIVFTQFGAGGTTYTAGTGLTLAGSTFSITNTSVTANSYGSASTVPTYTVNAQGQLTAAADVAIAIPASAITSGQLGVANGGTGASTLTGYVKGSGTAALTASATIPSTDITGLGTMATQNASAVAITGGSVNGTTIGASTASTGAFTTLSASSTVSGTGFSTYLASPPAIGGTTAAAGSFTTLSASSTVSGTGFSTYLASPPAIGGTTAAAGSFTTLSASSTVSGTGFSTYLASPPAIGGTTAAAGSFTALSYSTTLTGGTGIVNLGSGQLYKDASGNVGIGTATPGQRLDLGGGSLTLASSTGTQQIYLYRASATNYSSIGTDSSAGGITFTTGTSAPAERFRIGTAGQLGIGGATYGTAGQVLTSGGPSAAPTWSNSSSGVTSITAGTGLTGGTITTSGTIAVSTTYAAVGTYGFTNGGGAQRTAGTSYAGTTVGFASGTWTCMGSFTVSVSGGPCPVSYYPSLFIRTA